MAHPRRCHRTGGVGAHAIGRDRIITPQTYHAPRPGFLLRAGSSTARARVSAPTNPDSVAMARLRRLVSAPLKNPAIRRASNSFASGSARSDWVRKQSGSRWRTLRPSDHPSLSSPSRNAATRSFISGWSSARLVSTTTRRMRSGCCARRERPCSRTAEQRDEQQPSGWSGERYVHSHQIFAADAGAHHGRTTTSSAAAGMG